ncbi:MAG: cytochrome c, partial [candidate division Zixibacteria bacterium]|nr:cytochrome c [candidate division Zixibacteria bacterium]
MNLIVITPIILAMVALRYLVKMNIIGWLIVWWLALYAALRWGINPPLPSSIVGMFMGIITLALLAYLTASTGYMETAKKTIITFITAPQYTPWLILLVVALPVLMAYNTFTDKTKQPQPPISGRTIHPPPPTEITFKGKKIDLVNGENPFRVLQQTDPAEFAKHVENGRKVYYQNCAYCHGDNMAGDGIFAHTFDPIPANFQDPTTIAMLQESYIFWRVAKGAPGLPEESTPWASAMPAWENFLTEDEIWDVIIFMYEF